MKKCISNKNINVIKAILVILLIWYFLSMFNTSNVLPKINVVFIKIIEILTSIKMLKHIKITFIRLFIAMSISILGGIFLGISFAIILPAKEVFKEVLKIIQVIPPVSMLIMAIIWFGVNGIPAIFIVVFALIPLISIQVIDSIDNINKSIIEMGKVFHLSKWDMIIHIYIPSILAPICSVVIVGLAMGVKIIVMGEVLTTSTGIGGQITTARLNLEPETVIAWTIIMVCMYYLLEVFLNIINKYKQFRYKKIRSIIY